MHYVRFLKAPKITVHGNGKTELTCLITIASDLGDSFYPASIELVVVLDATGSKRKCLNSNKRIAWTNGARQLAVSINVPAWVTDEDALCTLSVWPECNPIPRRVNGSIVMPTVLAASTTPWRARSGGKSEVLRRPCLLHHSNPDGGLGGLLNAWEDLGESIAAHVWDAGMAFVACLDRCLTDDPDVEPFLPKLRSALSKGRPKALELGCGCGLVGIALAQMIPESTVLLTDLAEAGDVAERNIMKANLGISEAPRVSFCALDWEQPLPQLIGTYDLIMASDVTYNPDSSPSLVNTISRLSELSPLAPILIAMKRRHDAEEIFFDLMSDAGFVTKEHVTVLAPLDESEEAEDDAEIIDIYIFEKRT